ncbi:hypothetical protein AB1Y20_007945 [Prymnesium parvum]|uniref:Uncharacterized protein n=1 Tax=Prymnesium parvum TaxID=97485 RepID=A0AB34ISC0_PRYPA
MEGGRGPLAGAVRRLATGDAVTVVSVTGSSPPATGAVFTISDSHGRTICASSDFQKILDEIAVQEVPWAQFTQAEGWGLPPVATPLVSMPLRTFLFGCCDSPSLLFSVHELSRGFADDSPARVRAAVEDLLSALPAATSSTPEIVDSVHSRLRALLQSQDAPEPFIAFGLAWRQGTLEPPRRQSRAASPSPSLLRRASLTASPQSVTRAPRNLEEEVAAMTPNTMRQKLVEVHCGGYCTRAVTRLVAPC